VFTTPTYLFFISTGLRSTFFDQILIHHTTLRVINFLNFFLFLFFKIDTPTLILQDMADNNTTTLFSVFGIVVAVLGIAVAALQIRYMRRRQILLNVYELA
jgi:protein-S-isoprenylcysteine O-methyltransferase Ste14